MKGGRCNEVNWCTYKRWRRLGNERCCPSIVRSAEAMGIKVKTLCEVITDLLKSIGNRVIALKNCEIVNYNIFEALNMPKTFDEETYLLVNMILC